MISSAIVEAVGLVVERRSKAGKEARGIWYHGTNQSNLKSILSQGLKAAWTKNWDYDKDASRLMIDRTSYGGVYVTKNLMTALGSVSRGNRNKENDGDHLIVIMDLQPRALVADEDDFARWMADVQVEGSVWGTTAATMYWFAMKGFDIDKEDYNKAWDAYLNRFYYRYGLIEGKKEPHAQLKKVAEPILRDAFHGAIERMVGYFPEEHGKWWENDWLRFYSIVDPKAKKAPPPPDPREGEAKFREAVDKITRLFKNSVTKREHAFFKTARSLGDIKFSGSNRIVAIVSVNTREKGPHDLVVHYGTVPDDFFTQWETGWGSKLHVVNPRGERLAQYDKHEIVVDKTNQQGAGNMVKESNDHEDLYKTAIPYPRNEFSTTIDGVKIRYYQEKSTIYIDWIYASERGLGQKSLEKLKKQKRATTVIAIDPIAKARGFWDKMMAKGIVDSIMHSVPSGVEDEQVLISDEEYMEISDYYDLEEGLGARRYNEIEFVCWNADSPSCTSLRAMKKLYKDLLKWSAAHPGKILPYMQDFREELPPQVSLAVILLDDKAEEAVKKMALNAKVKVDLKEEVPEWKVDAIIKGVYPDLLRESVKQGVKSSPKNLDEEDVFAMVAKQFELDREHVYPPRPSAKSRNGYFHPGPEYYFASEADAKKAARKTLKVFHDLPDPIPVWRAIRLSGGKKYDDREGSSWSFDKEAALAWGRGMQATHLVSGVVDQKEVDWEKTIPLFIDYSLASSLPENEVRVTASKVKNQKVTPIIQAESVETAGKALVLVHVDSLDSYASQDGPWKSLGASWYDEVISFDGDTIVVSQGWHKDGGSFSRDVMRMVKDIANAADHVIEFDESEEPWGPFIKELDALLKKLNVSQVEVGGIWYDPSSNGGCATMVIQELKKKGYKVIPREDLLGCEEDLEEAVIALGPVDGDKRKKAEAALEEIRQAGFPFDHFLVFEGGNVLMQISVFQGRLHISSIVSAEKKQGLAGKVMRLVMDIADKHGVEIDGTAKPFGRGGMKKADLKAWYKRLGFEFKGDYMVRKPKPQA